MLHWKGPQSFANLKTVDGVEVEKYRKACILLFLLINNTLYNGVLRKASLLKLGFHLTQIFAMMCIHTPPSNPTRLFRNHFEVFTDNSSQANMQGGYSQQLISNEQRVLALLCLLKILKEMGRSLKATGIKVKVLGLSILTSLIGSGVE
jgi:hypothetical protein